MKRTTANIETAARLLGVGRTAALEEARGVTLDGIRVGRRMLGSFDAEGSSARPMECINAQK